MRAVIFDCDGVVVDSEPVSVSAWQTALAGLGVVVTDEEVGSFAGKTDQTVAEFFAPRAGVSASVMATAAQTAFVELAAAGLRTFPDAIALIDRLDGFDLAMASNSRRWRLRAVLVGAVLEGRFPVTVASDEVERPKPAPDVYLRAADLLALAPAECLVIEDSPTGIEAARLAGMDVIAVDRGLFAPGALSGATEVVTDLARVLLAF